MKISATGVVTNEFNELLLIQRADTETWAAPGGGMDPGETPYEAAAREIKEETGLFVMPVRLAYVTYYPQPGRDHLKFIFRCILRGGEIEPQAGEVIQVQYFKAEQLPTPMRALDLDRIDNAKYHVGPAKWANRPRQLLDRVRELFSNDSLPARYDYRVNVRLFMTDSDSRVVVDPEGRLPGGLCDSQESPWDAAERHAKRLFGRDLTLKTIALVQTDRDNPDMQIIFTAEIDLTGLTTRPADQVIGLEADWVDGLFNAPAETRFV